MGWDGRFTIKYSGSNADSFLKLAKMIIPNSIMRFNFNKYNNGSAELTCTRCLSWYSANEDMKRLVSYLPDGDIVTMTIQDHDEKEEIRIRKDNGDVIFHNSNPETDRYTGDDIGIPEMLFEEHSPMYYHSAPQSVDVCSIDGYTKLIANTFAADDELLTVVQEFLYEVLCVDRINSYADGNAMFMLLKKDCEKLEKLHEIFSTVESTQNYLKQVQCTKTAPDVDSLKRINIF